jgi:hypothetical protein
MLAGKGEIFLEAMEMGSGHLGLALTPDPGEAMSRIVSPRRPDQGEIASESGGYIEKYQHILGVFE